MREGHSTPLTRLTFFVTVTCFCLHVLQVIFLVLELKSFVFFLHVLLKMIFEAKASEHNYKGPTFVHSYILY